jgi:hypothetical protein
MAKAPPVRYGSQVKLAARVPEVGSESSSALSSQALQVAAAEPQPLASGSRRRPMESKADPTILYLHPDGKYELKRYALARGAKVKVHDLLLEAVEEWAERHGIAAPFRVRSERPRRDVS